MSFTQATSLNTLSHQPKTSRLAWFKTCLVLGFALVLQACTTIDKVEKGNSNFGDRFQLTFEEGWNKPRTMYGPAEQLTREGFGVDRVLIYAGIKDQTQISPNVPGSKLEPLVYKSRNSLEENVSMFQALLTRDGSQLTMEKISPAEFGAKRAVRFEFQLVRKSDNVRMKGVGYVAVDKAELFALVYVAPRLMFYPRDIDKFEVVAKSAKIN